MKNEKIWKSLHGFKLGSGHKIEVAHYSLNGRVAMSAVLDNGESWCMITVNLPDVHLEEYEFHVKNENRSMCKDVFDSIESAGIAAPTGFHVASGFSDKYAEVWVLTGSFLDKFKEA